jgi:hypothetical protein
MAGLALVLASSSRDLGAQSAEAAQDGGCVRRPSPSVLAVVPYGPQQDISRVRRQ